jgi:hypothetical protein
MRAPSLPAAAAAAACVLLGLADASRAELVTLKPKRVLVSQEAGSTIATEERTTLFQEFIELKGPPACVLVRYSGELIGTDGDGDEVVGVRFTVFVGDQPVQMPELHDASARILPQIVSFSGLVCGVEPGEHVVNVDFLVTDAEDSAAALNRTLELSIERGRENPGPT